jgi:lipopolysaccharide transport system ATP-binding protein
MKDVAADQNRTVLFVSHNMSAIKTLCNRAILLEKGQIASEGSVDQVVNEYFKATSDALPNGQIAENALRLSNGQARFRSVRLTDLAGREVSQLFYGQPFAVTCICDLRKEILEGLFEVSISTTDGIHVVNSTTLDEGRGPLHLRPGRHEVTVQFRNILLPGEYTLDLGVHYYHDGTTADFVQRTLNFCVLRVAAEGIDHYRWPQVRGLVRAPSKWSVATGDQAPAPIGINKTKGSLSTDWRNSSVEVPQ